VERIIKFTLLSNDCQPVLKVSGSNSSASPIRVTQPDGRRGVTRFITPAQSSKRSRKDLLYAGLCTLDVDAFDRFFQEVDPVRYSLS
jgi:hypothetical protein